MAGREVREYTNLSDSKDKKWVKGKDRTDDEDVTFQSMVAKKHPNKYYTPGVTGAGAQDAADVVAQLETNESEGDAPTPPAAPLDPVGPSATPIPSASTPPTGSVASFSNTEGSQRSKGKRKMRDIEVFESLAASFAQAVDNSRENAKIIANAIAGAQIPKLGEELKNLGFSTAEVVRIARIFAKNAHAGNLFWGLTTDQKQAYVRRLLDDEI